MIIPKPKEAKMMVSYEGQFKVALERLGKMHERSKVYVDFMDYYIYKHSNSPERRLPSGYKEGEMKCFETALDGFEHMMKKIIKEHGWYDYIGEYYEEYILAGSKASAKGQFYTPRQISGLLSEIAGYDVELVDAYDPACGSARNLLDYHSRNPKARLVGEDLDESACKMAVINFHAHNVDGVVNWIDALTREYMGTSWRILDGQIYITDMDWIRATEDIVNAVSILSLSDETIHDLLVLGGRVLNGGVELPQQEAVKEEKGGLDQWM